MPAFRLALLVALAVGPVAGAHYHMLLPDKHSVKANEEVTFTYQFGHPFEHELFDTSVPEAVYVKHPDGTKTDVSNSLKAVKVDGADGKKVTGYTFTFTPAKRGDYVVVAVSQAIKQDGNGMPLKDVTKVVLHVQTQNGWDAEVVDPDTAPFELHPLTRPYGLTPGAAFHVEVRYTPGKAETIETPLTAEGQFGKPVRKAVVEVEKYNPAPPKSLPADEFVTRTHRTSRTGTAVVTLPDAGWWGITAVKPGEKAEHRCTLWVYVDPAAK